MSADNSIAPLTLSRLIGLSTTPLLIDIRTDKEFDADGRFIPGAIRRDPALIADWAPPAFASWQAVVISADGGARAEGVAAWLRDNEIAAATLEGGHVAWAAANLPLVPEAKLPPRDSHGRTVWVTRARPKVDRIAVPWLIRRFVDPNAVFIFVPASKVLPAAERLRAAAFDIEGAFWGHRGDKCTFDALVEELGLETEALRRLASIVRGADTGRPDLTPESPGLLAVSLGLSSLYSDDIEQLGAGLALYDALYCWARDSVASEQARPVSGQRSSRADLRRRQKAV